MCSFKNRKIPIVFSILAITIIVLNTFKEEALNQRNDLFAR